MSDPVACNCTGACRPRSQGGRGRCSSLPWSEEDRLTYTLQAEGPDEFPEGYYRFLARLELGLEVEDDE